MNSGIGFGEITVTADQLSYTWQMSLETRFIGSQSPTFSDTFVIRNNPPGQSSTLFGGIGGFFTENWMISIATAAALSVPVVILRIRLVGRKYRQPSLGGNLQVVLDTAYIIPLKPPEKGA